MGGVGEKKELNWLEYVEAPVREHQYDAFHTLGLPEMTEAGLTWPGQSSPDEWGTGWRRR